MKKVLFILLFLITSNILFAQINCDREGHFYFELKDKEEMLYCGCYDAIHAGPHIVMWTLTKDKVMAKAKPSRVGFTQNRDGGILKNKVVAAGYRFVSNDMYTNSGYERGHMANAADFDDSQEHYSSTFFLANVWPQDPDCNNPGAWYQLEMYERKLASYYGTIKITVIVENFIAQKIGDFIWIPKEFEKRLEYENYKEIYVIPNISGTGKDIQRYKNY